VFHTFDSDGLPYHQQWDVGMEFAEVAATLREAIELIERTIAEIEGRSI
jgi:hypothetical protein